MVLKLNVNNMIGKPQSNAQLRDVNGNIIIKMPENTYDPTDELETRKIKNSGYWVKKVTEL